MTLIDTPGAQLSADAERAGVAGEIALTLATLSQAPTPIVNVLLGQGGTGAAVALLQGDRTLALADSGLWILPPEAVAALLHCPTSDSPRLARAAKGGADDQLDCGIVDEVVPGGDTVDLSAHALARASHAALDECQTLHVDELLRRRHHRCSRSPLPGCRLNGGSRQPAGRARSPSARAQ